MAIDTVTVRQLGKRYGLHRALARVDLELSQGSACALLGPNGAGKSTLLGILSTLVRPTQGEVVYQARDAALAHDDQLRAQIGVLAHSSFLYGELSAMENLRFYGDLYRVDDADGRATALLDEVGLEERARTRPARTYSRGMIQRLALARALMHDPPLLLLDEPFTGLDRGGAEALSRTLASAKERGCILVVVTHDLEAITGVADHVIVLRRGRIVHEERRADARGHTGGGFSYAELKNIYHSHGE